MIQLCQITKYKTVCNKVISLCNKSKYKDERENKITKIVHRIKIFTIYTKKLNKLIAKIKNKKKKKRTGGVRSYEEVKKVRN